jgi:hypothetical protein
VRYSAGSSAFSSSVITAGSNVPIAWSTPRQKVRVARVRTVVVVKA